MAQLLLISFATTRLHGICNGGIDGMEDGGGHTLKFHSLGTWDKPAHVRSLATAFSILWLTFYSKS